MLRPRPLLVLALLSSAVPLAAAAQEAAPQLQEDPRAARYSEVERGFFTGFEVGYLSFLKTPAPDPARYPFAAGGKSAGGVLVGVRAGFDLGSRIALSALALGGNAAGSGSYGAFDVLGVGGDLRVAPFGWTDSNGVERLQLYVHARAAYLRTYPEGLFGKEDFLLAGGPGIEYFTRLRHFAVGLVGDVLYAVNAKAPGFSIAPTLKYAF